MTHRGSRVVHVGGLSRVEGEGELRLRVRAGEVTEARLRIYEPPRFFEAFLRGRAHTEPPDITARVCGICPVAYQMSSCRAVEEACGVTVGGQLAVLRRLLYCGEWIESQTLHIHLLHAPDFLGYDGAIQMARDHRAHVERGLRIKQAGNAIVELLGGRAIHPVNVRLGGFHRVPPEGELRPLAERLRRARQDALDTVEWVAGFDFPDAGADWDLLALAEPGTYAIERGTPTAMAAPSSAGLDPGTTQALPTRSFPVREFEHHVVERQVPGSTALASSLDGRRHLTGPLARYAISGRWLSPSRSRPPTRPVSATPPPVWCAAIRSGASWCVPSKSSTRSTRRCASSPATSRRRRPPSTCRPARAPDTVPPRRRADCSTTVTGSPRTARSRTPR